MRVLLAAVLLSLVMSGSAAWGLQPAGRTIDIIEVGGLIDGPVAGFISDAIASANQRDVEVLVIRLDTPGAIGGDLESLLEDIRTSRVPIAIWIGPPGAQATGAGFSIAQNAHVLALSPFSALGMASLASVSAGERHAEFAQPAASGALIVAVPDGETGAVVPPSVPLPAGVDRTRVLTLDETALAERGIADFVAGSLPQMLARLDGTQMTVAGPDGTNVTRAVRVDPQAASVRFVSMGLIDRVLHTVASPALTYLLVIAGALALLFEVFQPGFGVAGVSGIALLALGSYGLWVLPISWGGVALIALGLLLLAADLALARLGWLTACGTLALAAGSWLAFPDAALLRPSRWLVVAVVIFCVVFFAVIMTVVLRAQGNQALAGAQTVVGSVGVVRSMLNPEGHVFVHGGLWRARAPESVGKVKTGTKVRVLGMNDQLTLDIEVVEDEHTQEHKTASTGL
jgi:membrane-bound serine protease (ClpP class)